VTCFWLIDLYHPLVRYAFHKSPPKSTEQNMAELRSRGDSRGDPRGPAPPQQQTPLGVDQLCLQSINLWAGVPGSGRGGGTTDEPQCVDATDDFDPFTGVVECVDENLDIALDAPPENQ